MDTRASKRKPNRRVKPPTEQPPAWGPGELDHAAVRLLQEALIENGFPIASGVTGTYGMSTAAAVRAVEKQFKLVPDEGIAGRQVLQVLDQLLQGRQPLPVPPLPPATAGLTGSQLATLDAPLALMKVRRAMSDLNEFRTTVVLRLGPQVRI